MNNKPAFRGWLEAMEGRHWMPDCTDRVLCHIRKVEESWRKLALVLKLENGTTGSPPIDRGPFIAGEGTRDESGQDLVEYCPCWATGSYVWVDGCRFHPRESAT